VILLELLRKLAGLLISLSASEVASAKTLSQSLSRWYYILVVVKSRRAQVYLIIN
jgi:hypothetical protein